MERLSEAARGELDKLMNEAECELLHPEAVVEFARDETTALHKHFTWDDSVAAERYRVDQARRVIRLYVIKVETKPVEIGVTIETRGMLSSPIDRANGGGYRRVQSIMADDTLREAQLKLAEGELRLFRVRYRHLTKLASVMAAIDEVFPEDLVAQATA